MEKTKRKPRVLFICTGNACRSQMAEAIGRHVAGERFDFASCGSNPAGYVHPLALATLQALEIPADGLESKGWERFFNEPVDIAITVCADADQVCPAFPGGGLKVAWPLPDPSFMPGSDHDRVEFSLRIAERLRLRLLQLAAIDLERTPPARLREVLEQMRDL